MTTEAYGNTDIGRMRRRNEDAFLTDPENGLFAVADGLGGLAAGDRASQMAVDMLKEGFATALREDRPVDFRGVFTGAHKAIRQLGSEVDPAKGAGSTLTAVLVRKGELHLAHIGDSAAYLFQKEDWKKLTTDHTEAEEFRRRRPDETVPSIFEHTLTRCLGQPGAVEVDLLTHPLPARSRLLLCTDGVTRGISPEEIATMIMKAAGPEPFVAELLDLANERGGSDNSTAIAIFLD